MINDEVLIALAQKGDEQAFTELVDRYQNKVYGTSVRMLGNQDEALESSQEVFLKVWTRLPTLTQNAHFRSWLYRITVNQALDLLRRRRPVEVLSLSEEDCEVLELPSNISPLNPRQVYAKQELRERVERAMESLPPQQKAVFVLRHFQNLKMNEIAEVMNISAGTVKATLHAALERLRADLSEKKRLNEERESGC